MDSRSLRLEIGNRTWEVLLLTGGLRPGQLCDFLSQVADWPDLVWVANPEGSAPEGWESAAREAFGADALAVLHERPDLRRWLSESVASLLVLGRRRFVERFGKEVAPQPEALRSTPQPRSTPASRAGFDPAGLPVYAEAGRLDPLALDPATRRAAWQKVCDLLGRLVREIHRHGVAVTWPTVERPGYADPDYKPWRSVAKLQTGAPPEGPPPATSEALHGDDESGIDLTAVYARWVKAAQEAYAAGHKRYVRRMEESGQRVGDFLSENSLEEDVRTQLPAFAPERGREVPLQLLQRLLLSLQTAVACSPGAADECWPVVAELLEELGYLAVPCSYSLGFPAELHNFLDGGLLLGMIHEDGRGYGDMHRGNYMYFADGIPLIIDPGGYYPFEHGGSPAERAADLAVLRLEGGFLQWQAACLGYRLAAPAQADAVFARFPESSRQDQEPAS